MEEEDVKMNPMMRQYNHWSQPHTPTTFWFFLIVQNKKYPQDQSTITSRPCENYYKNLECKAKKMEWHG
jgi:hypothetical protein